MSFLTGSGGKITSTPITLQSSLNTGQQSAADVLTSLLSGGGTSVVKSLYPSYTGQVAAPVSDATTGATSSLQSLVPGLTSAMGTASGVQSQGQTTLSDLLTTTPSSYQGYYDKNVFSPLLSAFGGSALGDIAAATGGTATNAAGGTAGGGAGTGAATGRALSQLGTTLGSTEGGLTYQTTEQNQSNIINALKTLSGVVGAPTTDLSTILSGGVTSQTDMQNYLDALYKNYTTGQTSTTQFLKDLSTYLGVQTQTAANQPVVQQGQSGALSGLGSLIGSLAGKAIASA